MTPQLWFYASAFAFVFLLVGVLLATWAIDQYVHSDLHKHRLYMKRRARRLQRRNVR